MVQREKITLGFFPSCDCNADTVPGTVLDCFGGTGTVGLVADRLQRDAILIELNPDYVAMAEKRLDDDRIKRSIPPKKKRVKRHVTPLEQDEQDEQEVRIIEKKQDAEYSMFNIFSEYISG
jgi:hypothetical protein